MGGGDVRAGHDPGPRRQRADPRRSALGQVVAGRRARGAPGGRALRGVRHRSRGGLPRARASAGRDVDRGPRARRRGPRPGRAPARPRRVHGPGPVRPAARGQGRRHRAGPPEDPGDQAERRPPALDPHRRGALFPARRRGRRRRAGRRGSRVLLRDVPAELAAGARHPGRGCLRPGAHHRKRGAGVSRLDVAGGGERRGGHLGGPRAPAPRGVPARPAQSRAPVPAR